MSEAFSMYVRSARSTNASPSLCQLAKVASIILLSSRFSSSYAAVSEFLRPKFESDFHDKCDKYPFVHNWYKKLEDPGDRYLVFVFQESGLRNGGLGDRLGGLISAVGMAARFNRTLLIRQENHLDSFFQPYHPKQSHERISKFSWNREKWSEWTNYPFNCEDNDDTEYDLWDCINNTGQKNYHCGMDEGDHNTPLVKVRSNRAYLCRWDRDESLLSNKQLRDILGVPKDANLMEVAGCMLRLVLWPTYELWEEVDNLYKNFDQEFHKSASVGRLHSRYLEADTDDIVRDEAGSEAASASSTTAATTQTTTTTTTTSAAAAATVIDAATLMEAPPPVEATDFTLHSEYAPVFQVAVHFRCGDRSYIMNGGFDRACVHDATGQDPHDESGEMRFGNPISIGECARQAFLEYSTGLSKHLGLPGTAMPTTENVLGIFPRASMLFVASDNKEGAQQMYEVVDHPYSLLSPQGCHIELDSSAKCTLLTLSYWFMLSMSSVIVTQTEDGHPTSAFSRYAAVYGLREAPLRDSNNCGDIKSMHTLSRVPQGNWFC